MAQFIYPPVSTTIVGVATEAKQDVMITELNSINTDLDTLVAVDYATSAKQDTLIAKDYATSAKQDTLIAKDYATSAKQDTLIAKDYATETSLDAFASKTKSTDVTEAHDYKAYTYVAAGNGAGQVETITYKSGGSGGTTVAVQTFAYDASDRVSSITKT